MDGVDSALSSAATGDGCGGGGRGHGYGAAVGGGGGGAVGEGGGRGALGHIRYGWWENTVTNHTDVRAAWVSALTRTVDVDEDTGAPASLSFVRMEGLGRSLLATTANIAQLPIRTNPRGWELTAHPSLESRRTAGFLRETVDVAEEILPGRVDRMMVHIVGPWSFGASVEFAGHALVKDRPAFKDCALTIGEGVREFAVLLEKAMGVRVSVVLHEPRVGEIVGGLHGATDFDPIPAVDREHVIGVWNRFIQQVERPVIVDCEGEFPEQLVDGLAGGGEGFDRVVVPEAQLVTTAGKDMVGDLLGRGVRIGWAATGNNDQPEHIARRVMAQWTQWTLDADKLPRMVDLVVPEGMRTVADASEDAARVRQATELLWRN